MCHASMLLAGCAINQYIVKVDGYLTGCHQIHEDGVHEHLESRGRISQPKQHYLRFEQAMVSGKHPFPFIPLLDPYVVIAPLDIKFGKEMGSFNSKGYQFLTIYSFNLQ